jgi:vacuolar-type H+-ATPase subunit I/STV1
MSPWYKIRVVALNISMLGIILFLVWFVYTMTMAITFKSN